MLNFERATVTENQAMCLLASLVKQCIAYGETGGFYWSVCFVALPVSTSKLVIRNWNCWSLIQLWQGAPSKESDFYLRPMYLDLECVWMFKSPRVVIIKFRNLCGCFTVQKMSLLTLGIFVKH